jgi:hypothetical protein
MGRTCTICTHPRRIEIDRVIVANETPLRDIARQWSVSKDAVTRHRDHIPAELVKAQEAQEVADAIDIMGELKRSLGRVNLLFDACDRWLRDADDPTQYDIGPRAHDVMVTYTVDSGEGRQIRKKERLSYLLDKAGVNLESAETKYTDPRMLLLRTSGQIQSNLELVAKLIGQLDERPVINVLITSEWRKLRTIMLEALAPYPDARVALADAIRRIDAGE